MLRNDRNKTFRVCKGVRWRAGVKMGGGAGACARVRSGIASKDKSAHSMARTCSIDAGDGMHLFFFLQGFLANREAYELTGSL